MTDTETLIRLLVRDVKAVRPLPRPWIRTLIWLGLAAPAVALIMFSRRHDFPVTPLSLPFLIEQGAAFATGIAAAMAAFASVVPGYSRRALLMPVLPLAVWLGTLGHGCLQDWLRLGPDGLLLQPDWVCFRAIAILGVIPAIVMGVMLKRGAPLRPNLTTALGGLAAAGLGNFGLRFVHVQDVSIMVLVWQCGAVFAWSALAGVAGPYLFNWRSVVNRARRERPTSAFFICL